MEMKIFGNDFPAVSVRLNKGESVYTQSGGMSWRDRGIDMETNLRGGVLKSLARSFTGESLFMATFKANQDNQEIVFSSTFPGQIIELDIEESKTYLCQKNAFLVAQETVDLKTAFTRKFTSGLLGGEGFLLQKITGNGKVFLESSGTVVERELAQGEEVLVDTGNVVAFEERVQYSVETVKGVRNILFGGEGLLVTKLVGPGKVYLQTLTTANIAAKIIPYMPVK